MCFLLWLHVVQCCLAYLLFGSAGQNVPAQLRNAAACVERTSGRAGASARARSLRRHVCTFHNTMTPSRWITTRTASKRTSSRRRQNPWGKPVLAARAGFLLSKPLRPSLTAPRGPIGAASGEASFNGAGRGRGSGEVAWVEKRSGAHKRGPPDRYAADLMSRNRSGAAFPAGAASTWIDTEEA